MTSLHNACAMFVQLILPVSSASRADSVGMSGVLGDFCYTMSLSCLWEAGEGWEILISKCRLVPAGSRPPEVVMGRGGDCVVGERGWWCPSEWVSL